MFVKLCQIFEQSLTHYTPYMCLCHVVGEMGLCCVAEVAFLFVDEGVYILDVLFQVFIEFKETFTRFERTSMLVYHVCDLLDLSLECNIVTCHIFTCQRCQRGGMWRG